MPDVAAVLREVDANRLMEHARRIAEHVRLPGSAGEEAAFEYAEKTLSSFGLAPKRHALPAYISLPESAFLSVAGRSAPCTTHSMLPSADVEAELIRVPDAADLARSGVAGKIVMTDGLAVVSAVKAAQEAGALGVVFVAGAKMFHEMIVSSVWGSPEPKDLDAYLRIPAVTVGYADGERIRKSAEQSPATILKTRVTTGWTTLATLSADVGPTENGYLLLTGHIDSWHHGAMDNASGNAAALEIARILAARADVLRRGARLVFWSGHSHGRYAGSTAYCDEFFQDLADNAFLHVNADCLGARGATLLTQAGCMAETWTLGDFAVRTATGERLEGVRFSRSCDQSFWGPGVPSLFSSVSEQPKPEQEDAASKAFSLMFGGSKSGGYGWWWHTAADTTDKLDPEFLRRDAQIFLAAAYKACADPVMPIDPVAGFAELAQEARDYARRAGSLLDFAPLLREVERTEELLAGFNPAAMHPKAADALIRKFERGLVPLMYVKGGMYGHDPATRQPPLPLLEETNLAVKEPDPHRRNALLILLKRRLNEVAARVRELADLLTVPQ